MIEETELQRMAPPSKAKIATATIVALLVAAVVLVVAVLPAEYGVDLIGTGRALGLIELAEAEAGTSEESAPTAEPAAPAAPQTAGLKEGEIKTPLTVEGWNKSHTGLYKVDSRELEIEPRQGMEFKYRMEKGATLVYTWDAPTKVRYEFHGEPEGSARGTYESYAIDDKDGMERGSGSFVAPFTGIHGWYWENTSDKPITVRLTSAGFYTGGKEFRKKGSVTHQLPDVKLENRK
jgi:hypothetical protein